MSEESSVRRRRFILVRQTSARSRFLGQKEDPGKVVGRRNHMNFWLKVFHSSVTFFVLALARDSFLGKKKTISAENYRFLTKFSFIEQIFSLDTGKVEPATR